MLGKPSTLTPERNQEGLRMIGCSWALRQYRVWGLGFMRAWLGVPTNQMEEEIETEMGTRVT